MYVGDGKNPNATADFNLLPDVNVVRLVNMVFALRDAQSGNSNGSGLSNPAIARVLRFFEAHEHGLPVSVANCRWASLEALLTHIRHAGPNCSQADLEAAIFLLPEPQTTNSWDHPYPTRYNTGD